MTVKEEDGTDEIPLWGSPITERSARKRSRELSQSPKGDSAGQSDTLPKSQSKRGSFEWESSSNVVLQKALGTSLCDTRQDCLSECLENTRTSLHTPLERRTSQSTQLVRCSDPAGFSMTRSSLGAGTYHAVSEPSVTAELHPAPKLLLDVIECTTKRPFCDSGKAPEDAHHGPITEEASSSNTDIPPGVLQRKVRTSRRRRTAPPTPDPLCALTGKCVESQTLQCLGKVSESHRLSVSALDLWQLFHSSDNKEEDFQGFYN